MTKQCDNGGSCEVGKDGKPICHCLPGYWGNDCDESKYHNLLK